MRSSNKLFRTSLFLITSLASSLALASGSDAVGHAQTGDKANYNLGKRVFAVKIACDSCSMPGFDLNKSSAQDLLDKLSEANLLEQEQEALSVYLKRRFKL